MKQLFCILFLLFSTCLFAQAFRIDPRQHHAHRFSLDAITEVDDVIYVFYSGKPRSGLISFRADNVVGNEWDGNKLKTPPHILYLNTPEQATPTRFYRYQNYLIAHNGANFYIFDLTNKEKPALYRRIFTKSQNIYPTDRNFWDKQNGKLYHYENSISLDILKSMAQNKAITKKMKVHSGNAYRRFYRVNEYFLFEDYYRPVLHVFKANEDKSNIHFHFRYMINLGPYLAPDAYFAGYLDIGKQIYIVLKKLTWGVLLIFDKNKFTQQRADIQPCQSFKFSLETDADSLHLQQITTEKLLIYNKYRRAIIIKPLSVTPQKIIERFYLKEMAKFMLLNISKNYIFCLRYNLLNISKFNYNELIMW